MKWFVPGDVPAGSIAVPTIGGVIDQVYQADNRLYWGDGSLRGGLFRIAHSTGYSAGQSTAYQWVVRSGSYSNTSSKTTADITGATDYKVTLSNVHTTQPTYIADKIVSLTIGGGQVTGGKLWFPATTTVATNNVQNGNGTGAQISVSGSTVTVVAGGSGYSNVGTGTFEASFNSIVAAVASGGNNANGVEIVQYAKGPVCDAWRARTAISGMPHAHITFYVERWKKADGTFLDFRRCAVAGSGMYDTANAIYNYTYDLDFKDGTTIIVGANGGDTRYQTIMNYVGASCGTFDTRGFPYWASANDAAWKAVAHERTLTECDYFKKTGIILPWRNDITLTLATPTVPIAFGSGGSTERTNICTYQPFGNSGIRSPLGAGGNGTQENPMQEADGIHWMALRQGNTALARVIRDNIRIGALHSMSIAQLGGGIFEPTTMYPPNVIPASVQTFTGMTPTRESVYLGNVTSNGYPHPLIASSGGLIGTFLTSAGNTYHQVCLTYGAFILDGEQWILDALVHASTSPAIGRSPSFVRQVTLGTTTYYGTYGNEATNPRNVTWAYNSCVKAVACSPATWADGTTNIVRSYIDYTVASHYGYVNALVSWLGSVKLGSSGSTQTKSVDYTGTGAHPELFQKLPLSSASELSVHFMENYEIEAMAQNCWLIAGTTTGAVLRTWWDYRRNYHIKIWASNKPHYMVDSWRLKVLTAGAGSAAFDYNLGFDAANPTIGAYPQALPGGSQPLVTMSTDGVSSTVTLTNSIQLVSGTRMASGSRIMVTATSETSVQGPGVTPPAELDQATWYYWKELTATTGQLCTDAGLTSPVTASTAVSGINFTIVPTNIPLDTDGYGTANGGTDNTGYGRLQQDIGPISLAKAYGYPDDNGSITNALANLNTMATALGGISFAANDVQYAWDTTRG